MLDSETFSFILKAVLLGIHAGISPGPVSTILITQSLLHGRKAGAKIALVPFLTDVPVICLIIPALHYLTFGMNGIIALISITGACLLCWIGYEGLLVKVSHFQQNNVPSISLLKAIGVNFFNPNLYIYWLTILGPLSVSALHISFSVMFLFITVYFVSITTVKLAIALAVGSVRQTLNWQIIVWVNRILGIAMFLIAASFFWQGWKILAEGGIHANS